MWYNHLAFERRQAVERAVSCRYEDNVVSKHNRIETVRHLLNHSFVRRVLILGGGTAVGQLVIALSSPLVTRLYTPEQFGMLSLFISVLAPILSLASLRYEVTIVLPAKDSVALHLLYVTLLLVLTSAIITIFAVLLFGNSVAAALNVPDLAPYFWLLPLSVLGGGVFNTLSYWGIRRKSFRAIGQARFFQSAVLVITQIGMGVLSFVPLGLFVGDSLSKVVGSSQLARDAYRTIDESGHPRRDEMVAAAKRYKRFPIFSVGPAVFNSITLQLPAILLSSTFGATPVGLYALGQRILGVPLGLVSTAVGQVLLGDAAEAAHTSPNRLAYGCFRAAGGLTAFAIIIVVPVALIAPWLFGILFGERWGDAGRYLQLLSPMLIAQFVSSPLGSILDVLERQDLHLIREVGRIALMLCAWGFSSQVSDAPLFMVGSLSVAGSLGYIFGLFLIWKALRNVDVLVDPPGANP